MQTKTFLKSSQRWLPFGECVGAKLCNAEISGGHAFLYSLYNEQIAFSRTAKKNVNIRQLEHTSRNFPLESDTHCLKYIECAEKIVLWGDDT